MVTRREVLIFGVASTWLSACGGGGGANAGRPQTTLLSLSRGTYGTRIVDWSQDPGSNGRAIDSTSDLPISADPAVAMVRLAQTTPAGFVQQGVLPSARGLIPAGTWPGFSLGLWVKNPNARTLNFEVRVQNETGSHMVRWNCAIEPTGTWTFLTMSPSQHVPMGWVFGQDAPGAVRITQQDNMAEGAWQPGEQLLFSTVYVDVASRPLFLITFDDGNDSQRNPPTIVTPPGSKNLLRSGQQIVEGYGFKGSLFLVPAWLGTTGVFGYGGKRNRFMSAIDAQAMHAEGWSVGSHTNSHPSSAENAGLRLLGPYGYFLSNPVDNLPALYVKTWKLDGTYRRRAISAEPATNAITFESAHRFLVNMPIVFTDDAPPGLAVGTTYYCQSVPSSNTATFATDQGSLKSTAVVTAAWTGLANYRYAGASNDDAAIFADIMAGVAGVAALGIPTAATFFALPQGAADSYVRSACIRARLKWVRGASWHAHTIPVGLPTGGGLSGIDIQPGGWLAQLDCVQTDAAVKPSIADINTYIDDTIIQGACGCSYHHGVRAATVSNLDNMCSYLRQKADAGAIDVVTLDQMAAILKLK